MKSIWVSAIIAATVSAATPAIGIVTASGHFTLQGSEVWGNATLFDGSTVETTEASSQLALSSGAKLQLGAGSRARVFAGRLMLDKGVGQISQASPFEVDIAGLKIRGAGVRVGFGAPEKTVEITSLTGVANVFGNGDILLASIPVGRHMNLGFQAAQNGSLTRTGCLLYKDKGFILQDDSTQEVVELGGSSQDLSKNLGNRVEIKGIASSAKPAISLATSTLTVSAVSPKSQGGCLVVASTLGAQTEMPAGAARTAAAAGAAGGAAGGAVGGAVGGAAGGAAAGAAAGLSTGAIVGIVAGVGAGGAAAAVVLTKSKGSTSP